MLHSERGAELDTPRRFTFNDTASAVHHTDSPRSLPPTPRSPLDTPRSEGGNTPRSLPPTPRSVASAALATGDSPSNSPRTGKDGLPPRKPTRPPASFRNVPKPVATDRNGEPVAEGAVPLKKPSNAFLLFAQDHRRRMQQASGVGQGNREVSQILGQMWKSMTDDEKKPYMDRAEALRAEFAAAYPNVILRRRSKLDKLASASSAAPGSGSRGRTSGDEDDEEGSGKKKTTPRSSSAEPPETPPRQYDRSPRYTSPGKRSRDPSPAKRIRDNMQLDPEWPTRGRGRASEPSSPTRSSMIHYTDEEENLSDEPMSPVHTRSRSCSYDGNVVTRQLAAANADKYLAAAASRAASGGSVDSHLAARGAARYLAAAADKYRQAAHYYRDQDFCERDGPHAPKPPLPRTRSGDFPHEDFSSPRRFSHGSSSDWSAAAAAVAAANAFESPRYIHDTSPRYGPAHAHGSSASDWSPRYGPAHGHGSGGSDWSPRVAPNPSPRLSQGHAEASGPLQAELANRRAAGDVGNTDWSPRTVAGRTTSSEISPSTDWSPRTLTDPSPRYGLARRSLSTSTSADWLPRVRLTDTCAMPPRPPLAALHRHGSGNDWSSPRSTVLSSAGETLSPLGLDSPDCTDSEPIPPVQVAETGQRLSAMSISNLVNNDTSVACS